MQYSYLTSQLKELPIPTLSLSPRDIEQIRMDIHHEERYPRIWKAISPYFVLPSWHKDFNPILYQEIISLIVENPLFLEKILIWKEERTILEQLFDFIAFSGLLDIPKNPNFVSIQLFLERSLLQLQNAPKYQKYCELALELQEYFQLDFGATASYLERLIEPEGSVHLPSKTPLISEFQVEESVLLYKKTTLQEQAFNISTFLEKEGKREIEFQRWRKTLKIELRSWIENHIDKTGYFEYILWSEEEHCLILGIQNGEFFFLWRGKQDLFELWLDEKELLLLPIMESWQKREWQYWNLPSKLGSQLKFLWKEKQQVIDLFSGW